MKERITFRGFKFGVFRTEILPSCIHPFHHTFMNKSHNLSRAMHVGELIAVTGLPLSTKERWGWAKNLDQGSCH